MNKRSTKFCWGFVFGMLAKMVHRASGKDWRCGVGGIYLPIINLSDVHEAEGPLESEFTHIADTAGISSSGFFSSASSVSLNIEVRFVFNVLGHTHYNVII